MEKVHSFQIICIQNDYFVAKMYSVNAIFTVRQAVKDKDCINIRKNNDKIMKFQISYKCITDKIIE